MIGSAVALVLAVVPLTYRTPGALICRNADVLCHELVRVNARHTPWGGLRVLSPGDIVEHYAMSKQWPQVVGSWPPVMLRPHFPSTELDVTGTSLRVGASTLFLLSTNDVGRPDRPHLYALRDEGREAYYFGDSEAGAISELRALRARFPPPAQREQLGLRRNTP